MISFLNNTYDPESMDPEFREEFERAQADIVAGRAGPSILSSAPAPGGLWAGNIEGRAYDLALKRMQAKKRATDIAAMPGLTARADALFRAREQDEPDNPLDQLERNVEDLEQLFETFRNNRVTLSDWAKECDSAETLPEDLNPEIAQTLHRISDLSLTTARGFLHMITDDMKLDLQVKLLEQAARATLPYAGSWKGYNFAVLDKILEHQSELRSLFKEHAVRIGHLVLQRCVELLPHDIEQVHVTYQPFARIIRPLLSHLTYYEDMDFVEKTFGEINARVLNALYPS